MKPNRVVGVAVLVIVLAIAVAAAWRPWWVPVMEKKANPMGPLTPLVVGSATIQVEIRRTEAEQELGLSYRSSLPKDGGMLFQYQFKSQPLYWMKGMEFPLDFIWIADGVVVETTEAVEAPQPEATRIATVMPKQPVDAVLEVNQGFVAEHQIKVGDVVKLGVN